jgi:hypothetical protein
VFGIDWLRTEIPIAKETLVFGGEAEVVADARRRAPDCQAASRQRAGRLSSNGRER